LGAGPHHGESKAPSLALQPELSEDGQRLLVGFGGIHCGGRDAGSVIGPGAGARHLQLRPGDEMDSGRRAIVGRRDGDAEARLVCEHEEEVVSSHPVDPGGDGYVLGNGIMDEDVHPLEIKDKEGLIIHSIEK